MLNRITFIVKLINQLGLIIMKRMDYEKKGVIIICSLIVLGVCFLSIKIYGNIRYFKGAVDSYITTQKIPKSKISNYKVSYNSKMGSWEENAVVTNHGQKYNYIYSMPNNGEISLDIYQGREGAINYKKLEYPPLNYNN